MVFALALELGRRCFKKALGGRPCTIEIKIMQINVSHIVYFMKIEIKEFFHLFGREKTP